MARQDAGLARFLGGTGHAHSAPMTTAFPTHDLTSQADAMHARFVREIASRAPLPGHVTAEAAAATIMGALTERLTRGAAYTLLNALPEPLHALFEHAIDERTGPVSLLDRPALLQRTADHLSVTPSRAETICMAVFHAMRELVPHEIAHDVAAQLPSDLQELWYAVPPSIAAPTISEAEPEMIPAAVFAAIERTGKLPPGIDGAEAFTAVMCIFSQRLSGGEARHLWGDLPATLRPSVRSCMIHRAEAAAIFDRHELVHRVATHLGTNAHDAEDVIRAVFVAVRSCLPAKDVHDVASQLPRDLREMWLAEEHSETR